MHPDQIGPFLSRTTPRVLAVAFSTMGLLFLATGFLTRAYNREKQERAERQYVAGQEAAAAGRYEEAIRLYTAALSLKRDEEKYLQALALALVEIGRTEEAETYLKQLTRTDPANGVANLMLARIYARRGDLELAVQYYQRAIYGLWPENPLEHRIQTRFELIRLFEENGELRAMEAELLRLLEEVPEDPELKKKIGRLFLSAKSYANAAKVFTEVTQADRRDAEAFAGLGDAEFAMGHYFSARTAYARALTLNPEDSRSRAQYELATEVISLNPMIRGLGSYTRLRRSQILVERARKALDYCLPEDRESLPEEVRAMLDKADRLIAGKIRQRRTAEAVEENIALAEQLEQYRRLNCPSPPKPDRALILVLQQLAS